jgi:competence protein ComEC
VRDRASAALGRGVPAREASLARGFVLGQDDRIDPRTVEDFRRSGLAHLLAVSGQNVLLLALLANPVLAALGLPLRPRLLWLLGLIAVYVPLAGAGASIQRAGVMGAAAVLALLAGRPASRAYALAGSAAVTLAINPRFVSDPGWQLSFAAVAGIFLLAAPLRGAMLAGGAAGPLRRGLAEGVATTIAASVATAPLIAHHFGSIPVGSLAANLVALPAVAPSMWLGMAVAALGQIPGLPVEPLNWVNSLLLAFIAQVAGWFAAPGWALAEVPLASPWAVLGAYALLAAVAAAALRQIALRRIGRRLRPSPARRPDRRGRRPLAVAGAIALLLAAALAFRPGATPTAPGGLRIDFLDVGQGDAVLVQPPDGPAVLVDGGPAGEGLEEMVRSAGAASLGTAILTHDQSDHAGGIGELLGELPIGRFAFAVPPRSLIGEAEEAGVAPLRLAAGDRLRAGSLRLDVLWPPRPAGAAGADPNARSLVLLARWHRFTMLLTGDAEAELVPLEPGPVDVLKVAHHGSEDAGLSGLLARADPRLAVVSVGADNPFGHPAPATLRELAASGAEVLRTDLDGRIELQVRRSGIAVGTTR